MEGTTSSPPSGTQVVRRVSAILRLVAVGPVSGVSLAAVATGVGLTKPTAHRLLSALAVEGLLAHDGRNRWHLGPEMFVMSAVSVSRFPIEEMAHPSLKRLAAKTGETALLSMRRGAETVCLLREEGTFPVRSFVLMEGTRFPLGIGSAGLVMLAHLATKEQDEVLDQLDLSDGRFGSGQSLTAIRVSLAQARTDGYAVNPGRIVEGSWGMAAAVFDHRRRPMWALVLTGTEGRFVGERRVELGRLLLDEAHHLSKRLAIEARPSEDDQ